jgi:hypothetical protein
MSQYLRADRSAIWRSSKFLYVRTILPHPSNEPATLLNGCEVNGGFDSGVGGCSKHVKKWAMLVEALIRTRRGDKNLNISNNKR